jgi:hypothetical protein
LIASNRTYAADYFRTLTTYPARRYRESRRQYSVAWKTGKSRPFNE